MTEAFSIGVGGRYWGMWTTTAVDPHNEGNVYSVNADRYGVFVQAAYKFGARR